jgi:hypothetical protein
MADMRALPISDTGEGSACPRRIPGPAHAARGNSGFGSVRPNSGRGEETGQLGWASRPLAAQVSLFFFLYVNLFSKPFKIDFKSNLNVIF